MQLISELSRLHGSNVYCPCPFCRTFPMHDSAQILQTKVMSFKNAEQEVHDWYENEHMNIMKIDALQSKWMIWNRALEIVQAAVIQIQTYLQRIDQGQCLA